jgi:hypothetical protein
MPAASRVGFLYLISTFCVRMPEAVRALRAARDLTRPPLLMRPAVDADLSGRGAILSNCPVRSRSMMKAMSWPLSFAAPPES